MKELIETLEKATGPDGFLDCRIREAVEGWKNIGGGYREWPDGRREKYDYGNAKPYTASLDAALTLVPEGMEWNVSNHQEMRKSGPWDGWAGIYGEPFVGSECDTYAATPALALCIAALKSRAYR